MISSEEWLKDLEEICDKYNEIMLTQLKFERILSDILLKPNCPLEAIVYHIICTPPFENIIIGTHGTGKPTYSNTLNLNDQQGSQCIIELWRTSSELSISGQRHLNATLLNDRLYQLISCFWLSNQRDEKSRLPSLQYSSTYQTVDNSLTSLFDENEVLGVFFCDLDNFKKVNDIYGEKTGDRVILEFASVLDRTVRPNGIAVHRSGDEFTILYPAQTIDDTLSLSYRVMQAVDNYDFQTGTVKVRLSAGISILEKSSEFEVRYKELEERAEKAVKPGGGKKNRGKTRLETSANQIRLPEQSIISRNLALCIIKSNIGSQRPFANPWLNMISRYVFNQLQRNSWKYENLNAATDDIINWIQPTINDKIVCSALPAGADSDFSAEFSPLDLAFAVAHGVFRAGLISRKNEIENETLEIHFTNHEYCADGIAKVV